MQGWRCGHCLPCLWEVALTVPAPSKAWSWWQKPVDSRRSSASWRELMLHRRQESVFAFFCQFALLWANVLMHQPLGWRTRCLKTTQGVHTSALMSLGLALLAIVPVFFFIFSLEYFVELYQEGIPTWKNISSLAQAQPHTQTGALAASQDLAFLTQVVQMFLLGSF